MSCMVYLPRDRYTTAVRLRIQEILREALHGVSVEYSATVGESALARLHVVVRAEPGTSLPDVDAAALEAAVAAAARTWDEDLAAEAARTLGEEPARALLDVCSGAIPETYKTDVPAAAALNDFIRVGELLRSGQDTAFDLWEAESYSGGRPVTEQSKDGVWRLTIYRTGSPITLTDVLPRLQHMGVEVVDEHPYEFAGPSLAKPFWIYDFGLARSREAPGPSHPEQVKGLVEDALMALWQGKVEDDGFNALVLDAHLTWQQVSVLRAYAKYLRQAGTTFSQRYIERVLRPERGHRPAAGPPVRVQVRPAPPAGGGRAERGHRRGDPRPARRGGHPGPRPDPPQLPGPDPGHPADLLLPDRPRPGPAGRPGRAALPGGQAGRPAGAGTARAPAAVRAVRVLAAAGGGAPAVRARWRGAACAGPTGGRTSAPRSSAWPRRRRSRTRSSSPPGPRAGSSASTCPTRPTGRPTRARCGPATRPSSGRCWT